MRNQKQLLQDRLFSIDFDIKWGTEDNGISQDTQTDAGKGNPDNFIFERRDSSYKMKQIGNPGSSPVIVYYYIGKASNT